MTTNPSWKNAALAALLSLSSVATGQQSVFVVPLSHAAPAPGAADEPPCRRLRLAPFRQAVREECRAVPECGGPADDLRALAGASVASPATTLEEEMDALVVDLFAPRFTLLREEEGEAGEEGQEDPFDALFHAMLGTSLRAYDRKALDLSLATMGVEEGGGEEEEVQEEYQEEGETSEEEWIVESQRTVAGWLWRRLPKLVEEDAVQYRNILIENGFDSMESMDLLGQEEEDLLFMKEGHKRLLLKTLAEDQKEGEDSYASKSVDYLEAAATPEEAAEKALDVMVASLARSGALAAKEQQDEGGGAEEVTGSADAFSADAVTTEWLPKVLSRLGNFVETHSRRRLSEEGPGASDPHARARERLARRLTEYSANVYVSLDGTVTMYTASHAPALSFLSSSSSASPPSSSFLGTGSRRADGCLRSRFDRGELAGGCGRAVGEFLIAVDGSPRDPVIPVDRSLRDRDVAGRFAAGHGLALLFLLVGWAVLGCAYCRPDEDEDEDEGDEQGLPKKRLAPYEFDYVALHKEDAAEEAVDVAHSA